MPDSTDKPTFPNVLSPSDRREFCYTIDRPQAVIAELRAIVDAHTQKSAELEAVSTESRTVREGLEAKYGLIDGDQIHPVTGVITRVSRPAAPVVADVSDFASAQDGHAVLDASEPAASN